MGMTAMALASGAMGAVEVGSPDARMGLTIASYSLRWRAKSGAPGRPPFLNALDVLDHLKEIAAAGLQIAVGGWTSEFAGDVRKRRESLGLYLEGQINLPRDDDDVGRFEREAVAAREAGAMVLRTAIGGRRYEDFDSAEQFERFKRASWQRLTLAEPVVRKHGLKLAVENHKDWRVPELLDMLRRLGSDAVGVCLDTGNSISLLEDPMAVVEALGPVAFTTHFKDMAVQEYEDGFLLSEVPLGEGMLDLPRIVAICRGHNRNIRFNLEMITRDPLKVPCLTDRYWATFPDRQALELARGLRRVRHHAAKEPLPHISGRDAEDRLAFEEQNVRDCFGYANKRLAL